jgi:adenosylmethionine-8-amino-7-oxononanoate aminotransferase
MATGMHFHSPSTLQRLVETCQKYELLVIADEIATGFGRTGSLFAIEQAKVVPDIVCLGKALTGGAMTLAATIASDRVFSQFYTDQSEHAFMHGPTYMGNPLACAAANASLDLFEREPRFASVAAIAEQFELASEAVRGLPGVVAARSLGAIFAIEFDACLPALETREFFVSRGIWLRPIGKVLYACPPLTIQPRELATVVDAMIQFAKLRSPASV